VTALPLNKLKKSTLSIVPCPCNTEQFAHPQIELIQPLAVLGPDTCDTASGREEGDRRGRASDEWYTGSALGHDVVVLNDRAGNAVEGGTHENVYPRNSVGTIELPLCEERALDATLLERPCNRRCACRDSQRLRNLGGHVTVVAHRLAEPTR
jgi:hypothetical protein